MSTESAISQAIRMAGGQVALREALIEAGAIVTQQAISLWKVQGYIPKDRHQAVASVLADDPDIQQAWLDAFVTDFETATRKARRG